LEAGIQPSLWMKHWWSSLKMLLLHYIYMKIGSLQKTTHLKYLIIWTLLWLEMGPTFIYVCKGQLKHFSFDVHYHGNMSGGLNIDEVKVKLISICYSNNNMLQCVKANVITHMKKKMLFHFLKEYIVLFIEPTWLCWFYQS